MTTPTAAAPTGDGDPLHDPAEWEAAFPGAHVFRTVGWTRGPWAAGTATVLWQPGEEWTFPTARGRIVHGGLVSALLDCAMASAAYTLTGAATAHLTAQLDVSFLRAVRPGPMTAIGTVVRLARNAVFTRGEVTDLRGQLLTTASAVQVPAGGPAVAHAGSPA